MLPPLMETVELVGYNQEDEDFQVLIPNDSFPKESPITKRQTEYKTYDDLVLTKTYNRHDNSNLMKSLSVEKVYKKVLKIIFLLIIQNL